MVPLLITVFAALLGLAFGSFLNVCLSRWPEEESIVKPRSHCRACGRTLAWWENLPLVSWLALRGRCRMCKTWIGWRYPLVELAVGVLWGAAGWHFASEVMNPRWPVILTYYNLGSTLATFLLLWILVALAALDAEYLWLPNWLTLPGIIAGFLIYTTELLLLVKVDAITGLPLTASIEHVPLGLFGVILERLAGILIATGVVLLIRWAYWLFRKQEGMGMGDAKLMALLAAWLGLPGALVSFVLGVVLSAAFALLLLALPSARRGAKSWASTPMPFGTFLCIGGIVSSFWGPQLLAAYLRASGLT